ncbi:MAG: DUF1127 domain-containing protein [Rhodobacter sp.]|uniref:DUF1127 domain-containing protein n=1 Tax=Pararhodobacter sp. TaxID=2127056 RepID=UPI001DD7F8B5|nr:DUF1127 domain-containing protein [Pararhodobacter sp.]MCB1344952.1 DUF1127 domain-containing protein [Paracoccaceae bacterium]MCC0073461.1 DUF1127 domain-containing protein [Rhodobacter sp.]HPD91452.1 DUF1127 domain-containing protein [Pararhodobacter sp.]
MTRTLAAPVSLAAPLSAPAGRRSVLGVLRLAPALLRQRRALAELDDARLRDLGLTRAQARSEADRPFWDAPAHWR